MGRTMPFYYDSESQREFLDVNGVESRPDLGGEDEESLSLLEQELYQVPAFYPISLLANSIYYALGFTAIVMVDDRYRLVVCRVGDGEVLLNQEYPAPGLARKYVQEVFIAGVEGGFRAAPPVWTDFYFPEAQWLQQQLNPGVLVAA